MPASWSLRSIRRFSGPTTRLGCLYPVPPRSRRGSVFIPQTPSEIQRGSRSCRPPFADRPPHRRPDHLFTASRPATVLARLLHRDREVIAAFVVSRGGTGRAPRHPVPADLP